MHFSAAVARRLAIAEQAAAVYIANPHVAAVLVAASPRAAVGQLCEMAEDTFDLVEQGLPEFKVAAARTAFEFRRNG